MSFFNQFDRSYNVFSIENLIRIIVISFFVNSFGLIKANAVDMHGVFMVVKGTVQVENLKKEIVPAKVGSKIYPGEKVITLVDSRAKIVMTDRNVMNISPETKLVIKTYVNDPNTGTKNVELELSEGKVRNNVEQKYDGEKSKFIIKTPTAVAGVRGTQFLTSFDVKTRVTNIVTFKGAVQVATIMPNGSVSTKSIMIKKGETSSVKAGSDIPEAPKVLPKEEMKSMDKDSQAQKKENSAAPNREVASENGNGSANGIGSNEAKNTLKDKAMVDRKDLDILAPENRPSIPMQNPNIDPGIKQRPVLINGPDTKNPVISEIIRGKLNKTKVNVKPVIR